MIDLNGVPLILDLQKSAKKTAKRVAKKTTSKRRPYGHKAYTRRDPKTGKLVQVKAKGVKPNVSDEERERVHQERVFRKLTRELGQTEGTFDFLRADGDLTVEVVPLRSMQGQTGVEGKTRGLYYPSLKTLMIATDHKQWQSFVHEFGHYLDHKLGEHHGIKAKVSKEDPRKYETRPYASGNPKTAMGKFVAELKKAPGHVNSVTMYRASGHPKFADYRSEDHEVFARFFNEWLHGKFTAAGIHTTLTDDDREWAGSKDFAKLGKKFEALLDGYGVQWRPKGQRKQKPQPAAKSAMRRFSMRSTQRGGERKAKKAR